MDLPADSRKKVLIVGATSAIAQAVAQRYAAMGAELCLAARSIERLDLVRRDLEARGASCVHTHTAEIADVREHESLLARAREVLGRIDVVLIAYGSLTDQARAERDADYLVRELDVNFTSVAALLTRVAAHFESQSGGTIAVISSVAGERGRGSNYCYGAAKAGLSAYCAGLRNRLSRSGVHVLTVLPGFVDTPMTKHLKKGFLFASPQRVGAEICRAIESKRNILFTPWFWLPIMTLIRAIPEFVFKRMRL